MENGFELYKHMLKELGDSGIWETLSNSGTMIGTIVLNKNKTVPTGVEQYAALPYVESAEPNYVIELDPCDEPPKEFKLNGIYPVYNNDSITLGCVHEAAERRTTYRWKYCVVGESQWHLISDWNKSEWCTWYPDANENYVVVCKASYYGKLRDNHVDRETVWYVSRPQMKKRITGKCAQPTKDGLLFGCTSTVGKNDKDSYTTCYIWSHTKQAWITQSSYPASVSAWYHTSSLPKGTYMMYTCTEKQMPNGQKRKLSCDYYLFQIN